VIHQARGKSKRTRDKHQAGEKRKRSEELDKKRQSNDWQPFNQGRQGKGWRDRNLQ